MKNNKECDCGACKPKKCNGCGKIKQGFEDAFTGKFYCVDCINKSWSSQKECGV